MIHTDTGDRETLQAVTDLAAEILTQPARRAAALTYLRQRGIDTGALPDTWMLGYAPPGWTRLVDALRPHFRDQDLLAAGVATRSSHGSLIDVFRDRVIFGIRDTDGATAGFIGRDLSGSPAAPKYLNTRDSAIFSKGRLLYGRHEALATTEGARMPVVVEGPLDVLAIAAHPRAREHGYAPVAACGTAFTGHHAYLTARLAAHLTTGRRRAVVTMDGDTAGRSAATTTGEQLRTAGLDVRVATLPNGLDPAEHLTRPDVDLDFLDDRHTLPLLTVHVQRAIAAQGEHMQWIEGRLAAARAIASYLASYPAEHTGRQIGWIAQALSLSPQTFSAEIIDAYHHQTPHSATETPTRHPQPALTIAR